MSPSAADGRQKVAAIVGRPAIEIVPEIPHDGFAVYRTALKNGTLDSNEIWHDYVSK
jgi:hypothetical protein